MSYTALYRKFRPNTFDDVIGQEHIVKTIKNQILSNRVSHAYLFCGTRGTGKTSTAKIFARAINCMSPKQGNPCNQCELCRAALENRSMNVIEIDAASNNGVDNIRDIKIRVTEIVPKPTDVPTGDIGKNLVDDESGDIVVTDLPGEGGSGDKGQGGHGGTA